MRKPFSPAIINSALDASLEAYRPLLGALRGTTAPDFVALDEMCWYGPLAKHVEWHNVVGLWRGRLALLRGRPRSIDFVGYQLTVRQDPLSPERLAFDTSISIHADPKILAQGLSDFIRELNFAIDYNPLANVSQLELPF
jgi:hypothetical protein